MIFVTFINLFELTIFLRFHVHFELFYNIMIFQQESTVHKRVGEIWQVGKYHIHILIIPLKVTVRLVEILNACTPFKSFYSKISNFSVFYMLNFFYSGF